MYAAAYEVPEGRSGDIHNKIVSAPDGRNPLDEKAIYTKARLAKRPSPTPNFHEDPCPEVGDSAFTVASHTFFNLTYPKTTNFPRNHHHEVDILNCLLY